MNVQLSEETEERIKLVAEELKDKEMTTAEIQKKFKMNRAEFLSFMVAFTSRSRVYEYRVGNKVYLGLLKRWEDD